MRFRPWKHVEAHVYSKVLGYGILFDAKTTESSLERENSIETP